MWECNRSKIKCSRKILHTQEVEDLQAQRIAFWQVSKVEHYLCFFPVNEVSFSLFEFVFWSITKNTMSRKM